MSFNSNRRKALDENIPLDHRASHARSCALHVANKLGIKREDVIALVEKQTSVSLHYPENIAQLLLALEALEAIREDENKSNV